MNEFFFAQRGFGATLNKEQIRVSDKTEVMKSCLVTGFPYTYVDRPNGPVEVFARFVKKGIPIRRLGSAALDMCWVAAGRFDGFYEHSLHAWDSAGASVIVEEAGGKVSDLKGNDYNPDEPGLVASNGKMHEELLKWINDEV